MNFIRSGVRAPDETSVHEETQCVDRSVPVAPLPAQASWFHLELR
jgi:hypothetical protein